MMLIYYEFDDFGLGMCVPKLNDEKVVDEFNLVNFEMSNVISAKALDDGNENLFLLKQVHGSDILVIQNGKIEYKGSFYNFDYSLSKYFEADSAITVDMGIRITIRSADCAPLMFYGDGLCGGIHCGWRGLKDKIISKTISIAKDKFNFDVTKSIFFILPCIHSCCYEVGKEFLEWAERFCLVKNDKVYFDIPRFILSELLDLGALEKNIYYSPLCTSCYSNILPSYRATRTEDRIESFIYLSR
ncbi:MAG: polyphenol oxidase family protein [Brevinematales bacterium]|nr:polyphenol oxidase family protein [Brevinematales bacterium]